MSAAGAFGTDIQIGRAWTSRLGGPLRYRGDPRAGALRDRQTLAALAKLAAATDETTSSAACRSLGQIGHPGAVPAQCAVAGTRPVTAPPWSSRRWAVDPAAHFVSALHDPDRRVRQIAARALVRRCQECPDLGLRAALEPLRRLTRWQRSHAGSSARTGLRWTPSSAPQVR